MSQNTFRFGDIEVNFAYAHPPGFALAVAVYKYQQHFRVSECETLSKLHNDWYSSVARRTENLELKIIEHSQTCAKCVSDAVLLRLS